MTQNGQRITITVSEENLSWLDANYNNRSGYINDLLTKAKEGSGQVDDAIRRYQIQQLKSEITGMETEIQTKKQRLETLENERENEIKEQERLLEEAKSSLDGTELVSENPAVQTWAEKVGMTPEELIEEVRD
jgi:predicted  nucleic acid-binding Zn-ribbon protein